MHPGELRAWRYVARQFFISSQGTEAQALGSPVPHVSALKDWTRVDAEGPGKRKEEKSEPSFWGATLEAMLDVGACCLLSLIHNLTLTYFPSLFSMSAHSFISAQASPLKKPSFSSRLKSWSAHLPKGLPSSSNITFPCVHLYPSTCKGSGDLREIRTTA